MQTQYFDILVIGSGAAGLTLALSLADEARVAIISKNPLLESSSLQAQGGIATVMAQEDSFASHIDDTLNTGAGLCDQHVVEFTVEQAKPAIEWLIQQGVIFTHLEEPENKKEYHLSKEGGHSHRRVLHVDDKTGQVVVHTLASQALANKNITCFTEYTVIDLICKNNKCLGCIVLDNQSKEIKTFIAKKIILATGGASFVYSHTTNTDHTTGDGIAVAYRAGCRVADMEFQQFHPTCLYHQNSTFLISESVRGEGGTLILPNGERFMPKYDKRAELAPRDIVTRAIKTEMNKHHLDHVYVDISHKCPEFIQKCFPTIYKKCLEFGIDITKEPIPVSPAAHYTCGGVMTDLSGKTDIENLFAIGETAFTGLHGANRMASNSLLECLVFAVSAAKSIKQNLKETLKPSTDNFPTLHFSSMPIRLSVEELTQQIRQVMWQKVGIIRGNTSLQQAKKVIKSIKRQVNEIFLKTSLNKNLIELRNLAEVAMLIIQSALLRKESRGAHYTADYDFEILTPNHTILKKTGDHS